MSPFGSVDRSLAWRPGAALASSVLAHTLVGLALLAAGRHASTAAPHPALQAPPTLQLVTLPPLPTPPKSDRRPENTLPRPKRIPRPQVIRGKDLPDEVFFRPETPPPVMPTLPQGPTVSEPVSEVHRNEVASAEPAPPAIESEAQRLFGSKRSGAGLAAGPLPARSWINAVTEDRANDCVPRARPARAPGTPVDLGVITGIVYREGTREPLGGAFLQILGTPYSAFADARGAYALSFDKSLVDDCRTQYVQVSKDGFAPRRLILSLGHRVSNDIPLNRR